MEKIRIDVQWCDKNFGAAFGDNVPGAVVFTSKSMAELQKIATETLQFHIEGMIEDGDDIPTWLAEGDYEFEWNYIDAATLLRAVEHYANIAAISRASGINANLLSHYANRIKTPSRKQYDRIIDGIHRIGRELIAV